MCLRCFKISGAFKGVVLAEIKGKSRVFCIVFPRRNSGAISVLSLAEVRKVRGDFSVLFLARLKRISGPLSVLFLAEFKRISGALSVFILAEVKKIIGGPFCIVFSRRSKSNRDSSYVFLAGVKKI